MRGGAPLQFRGTAAVGGPLRTGLGSEVEFIRETGPPNLANAAVAQNIDNAAAVDVGPGSGLVGIPAAAHGRAVGDWIVIAGTTNYDGLYQIATVSAPGQFEVVATFQAEVFAGGGAETFRLQTVGDRTQRRYRSLTVAVACPGASAEAIFFSFDNRQTWTQLGPGLNWSDAIAAEKIILGSTAGTGTYEVTVMGV